ncbi:hypothetical protein [Rothia koreensis]|jgi:hypothetical protein|nr:hypothetical protein [Rothia koreensis]
MTTSNGDKEEKELSEEVPGQGETTQEAEEQRIDKDGKNSEK